MLLFQIVVCGPKCVFRRFSKKQLRWQRICWSAIRILRTCQPLETTLMGHTRGQCCNAVSPRITHQNCLRARPSHGGCITKWVSNPPRHHLVSPSFLSQPTRRSLGLFQKARVPLFRSLPQTLQSAAVSRSQQSASGDRIEPSSVGKHVMMIIIIITRRERAFCLELFPPPSWPCSVCVCVCLSHVSFEDEADRPVTREGSAFP